MLFLRGSFTKIFQFCLIIAPFSFACKSSIQLYTLIAVLMTSIRLLGHSARRKMRLKLVFCQPLLVQLRLYDCYVDMTMNTMLWMTFNVNLREIIIDTYPYLTQVLMVAFSQMPCNRYCCRQEYLVNFTQSYQFQWPWFILKVTGGFGKKDC